MKHFILVFVLLLMLNPYADAGRTAKLWRIIANVTAEKRWRHLLRSGRIDGLFVE